VRGVIGEQRGDLQGHPAIDPVGALVDRQEQVRRTPKVLDREFEEELFVRDPSDLARMASS
jgi:hypothetical protein